ncbi:unnamed protein product [Adineta steineri]|uniref:BZIP domain-containing protein n=1 Tax=Adineta steineri TaxID=433720 RepID=A0A814GST1_9BILA|nr:unnamed protein product [Adineta steineri]
MWQEESVNPIKIISSDFKQPLSLFVTSNGDIYIDDGHENGRVQRWNAATSTFVTVMNVNSSCAGLFVDIHDTLYCSMYYQHQVLKTSLNDPMMNSNVVTAAGIGIRGLASNQLDSPFGIFVDVNLDLYVADCYNDRVQLFQSGELHGITVAGSTSLNPTITLRCPSGITLDADKYLFIVDFLNSRIVGSDLHGFRCLVGCYGQESQSNQLANPVSFSFDRSGNIYYSMNSLFNSVDSIVSYLRAPISTSGSQKITNDLKSSKKQRKDKGQLNVLSTTPNDLPQVEASIEILPKGRVRYGPVTVNPRKLPSKTLYTGRRSKYEVLSTDEEEKRRDRRERNRVAATKCREKRENVLSHLEIEYNKELKNHENLLKMVDALVQQKQHLESVVTNHLNECPLLNNSPSMVFGDTGFLSSIIDTPAPLLPSYQPPVYSEEEELSNFLDSNPILTNSAYDTDSSHSIFIPQQQQQQPLVITMTNSSIERLMNSIQSPAISMDNSNNHSILVNSAFGASCAKQHSNSSEDDSLPSTRTNPYVC